MVTPANQIVVYQPDEVLRLEVRLERDTVWLNQTKIGELFRVDRTVVNRHIKNIYTTEELTPDATCAKIAQVQIEGGRTIHRTIPVYNLDVIIAVGYRVNSKRATQFRQWATKVLREYLLRGYAVNERLERLERKVMKHDEQLEVVLKTSLPPSEGIFFEGQLWDACSLVERLIARAKYSILLIDNWVGVSTLDMLAKKRKGVAVTLITTKRGNQLASSDFAKFNAQYGTLTLTLSSAFHDRFLILDDKELYLIGASLKDLGKKCFGFTKMNNSMIPYLKAQAT